jgi:hypothetical protein
MNPISTVVNWEFLQEPLYRWALFLIALTFIAYGWNGVLTFMKFD